MNWKDNIVGPWKVYIHQDFHLEDAESRHTHLRHSPRLLLSETLIAKFQSMQLTRTAGHN